MNKLLFSYLKFWAVGYLKRTKPEIVAVTGSVGKTSTKEAIFEVLKIKFNNQIRKSEGNLNNETGVPAAILGFKSAPSHGAKNPLGWIPIMLAAPLRSFFQKKVKILVLELAADKPGDIKYLTEFVQPKVAVLTSIGPAHLAAFGTMDKIIEEKTNLLRALPTDGWGRSASWAVFNLDDENVRKMSYGGRYNKKTYAIKNQAEIKASDIWTAINDFVPKTKFKIKLANNSQKLIEIKQNTLGIKSNVLASLAAAAVGEIYELSNNDIVAGLSNVMSEKHRMNVLRGKNNSTIIDDSYNANPLSMRAALDLLDHLKGGPARQSPDGSRRLAGGRKIAVIGDMREIGNISNEAHRLIGEYAKQVADIVIAVGSEAKKYQGQQYFKSADKASEYLLKEIRSDDIILIKASRSVGLDKIVESLKV